MDTNTDAALWAASLRGDADAFGVLFDRHHARVHRHATRLLCNSTDAEDVTAAAFLELWRRGGQVHVTAGSVLPWLLVTTTNLARNVRRGTGRYRELLDRLHSLQQLPGQGATPDAADTLTAGDLADEQLIIALRTLKAADLQLITLMVLEDFTLPEAADALGLSPGAAKTRLHRARARLRTALADHPAARRLRILEGQHTHE